MDETAVYLEMSEKKLNRKELKMLKLILLNMIKRGYGYC